LPATFEGIGVNFVRYPVNPATVSRPGNNWAVTQAAINELIADGMTVDICCWYVNPQPGGSGTIVNMTTWETMWKTVDGVYKNNNSVYYEPINEPFGYSLSGLEGVYTTFLGLVNKSQNHFILGGTGYEDNVTGIGGDSAFNNCLLAVHDYAMWATHTTDAAWSTDLYDRVYPYQGRTIMTEFGADTTTGLNYATANSGNNDICFVRSMCNQCVSWGGWAASGFLPTRRVPTPSGCSTAPVPGLSISRR
jgi:endoglucanase